MHICLALNCNNSIDETVELGQILAKFTYFLLLQIFVHIENLNLQIKFA